MEMSTIKQLPQFEDVARIFGKAALDIHPSFAHGCWVGLIVGGRHHSPKDWVDFLTQKEDSWGTLDTGLQHIFLAIAEASIEQLADIHYVLQILLPNDDEELDDRLYAMSEWCQGFVRALEGPMKEHSINLAGEALEAFADIQEVTDVSLEIGDDPHDEENFSEVVEYLRVAVCLIHHEILSGRSTTGEKRPHLH